MQAQVSNVFPIQLQNQARTSEKKQTFIPAQGVPLNGQTGEVKYIYDDNNGILTFTIEKITTSSPILYGHFHLLQAPSNPVVQAIPEIQALGEGRTSLSREIKNATWRVPAELQQELKNGNIYINIHTQRYPNGEIEAPILI